MLIQRLIEVEEMKHYKIGFICGFFDIVHDGHINILRWAKEQCDMLIVSVGTDEFMQIRKQRQPVMTYEQRVNVIKSIRYVDKVVPERDLDKVAAYWKYGFDVMFSGSDHKNEKIYIEAEKKLKNLGVDIVYLERSDISSTSLRARAAALAYGC